MHWGITFRSSPCTESKGMSAGNWGSLAPGMVTRHDGTTSSRCLISITLKGFKLFIFFVKTLYLFCRLN